MTTTEQAADQGTEQPVWFDALAHTVSVDGDWPRCAECGEYGSHEDCQPEAMTGHPARTGHADLDAAMSTHGEAPQPGGAISASMVAALESAWSAIRVRHPEVPAAVVIVLGGGSDGRPGTLKLGHFAALRWIATPTDTTTTLQGEPLGEVFVGGEGLARRPVEVLGTLLHEAAHALADVRGVKDTSRQGRWHNARFKALAEELGIKVSKDPRIGWSPTTVTDATVSVYAETLAGLSRALRMQRAVDGGGFGPRTGGDGEGDADGPGDTKSKRKTTSAHVCGCGRRIRVAPTVFALGPIVCGLCERPFSCDDGDRAEQGEAREGENEALRVSDEHDDVESDEVTAAAGVAS